MLRLPPFRFRKARSLAEAADILAGEGAGEVPGVRLVAGGTDLWPNMKRRHQTAHTVVSLMGVAELRGIGGAGSSQDSRDALGIGATTTLDEIARSAPVRHRYPALARAASSVAAPVLRNMGTLGGNVCLDTRCNYYNQNEEWRRSIDYCMKEAGEVCWVAPSSPRCWAISASDTAPVLCALDARVRLVSKQDERLLPIHALYQDDGIDYLTKRPDEVLAQVLLPPESAAGGEEGACRSSFRKLRRRGAIDFSTLTVAAAVWSDAAGRVTRAALYLGAVASLPKPVPRAAELLVGQPLSQEVIAEAARLARRAATPLDNTDFLAQWRGKMVETYTTAALQECAGLPVKPGGLPVL